MIKLVHFLPVVYYSFDGSYVSLPVFLAFYMLLPVLELNLPSM